MRTTDISAAFGLAQLEKLKKFSAIRKKNFKTLKSYFQRYQRFFVLPEQGKNVATNWLAFPLMIKPNAPFSRTEIVTYLENHDVQTRPIFTGNILKQPGFRKIKRVELKGGYPNADFIMKSSFVVGCHHGLTNKHMDYLLEVFEEFLKRF